jgi:acetyl esterase/lipase
MLRKSKSFSHRPTNGLAVAICIMGLLLLSHLAYAQNEVILENGIVYCSHGGMDLKLDMAMPKSVDGNLPALMYLSGNGWGHWWGSSFDRNQHAYAIKQAAAHGYVAVAVDYRPTSIKDGGLPKYRYPAQLQDVRSAVRWLRANSAKYHIDSDRIAAIGFSSGAHLALMLGVQDAEKEPEAGDNDIIYSSKVQAIVTVGGPTELSRMYHEATYPGIAECLSELIGGTPEQREADYYSASPLYFVTKDAPPTLIIQGETDNEVPLNQATLLYDRMIKLGVQAQLVQIRHVGHADLVDHPAVFPFLDSVFSQKR